MKKNLRLKLLLPLLIVGSLLGGIGGSVIHVTLSSALDHQFQVQAKLLVNAINYAAETATDIPNLQRQVMALGAEEQVKHIIVVSGPTSRVIASTKNNWIDHHLSELPINFSDLSIEHFIARKQGEEYYDEDRATYDFARPIRIRNREIAAGQLMPAAIIVQLDNSVIQRALTVEGIYLASWIALLITSLGLLIYVLLQRLILKPARTIAKTLAQRAQGDQKAYATVSSPDELGQLANALNHMLDARDSAEHEIQRTTKELQFSQQRYAGIVTTAMDAIIVLNEHHNIVMFNKTAEQTFGYKQDDVLNKNINILLPEAFRTQHTTHLDSFIAGDETGRPMSGRQHISGLHASGQQFPIEASISKVNVDENTFLTAILRDISERRASEEALKNARDKLEERVKERTLALVEANEDLRTSEARLNDAQRIARIGNWELDLRSNDLYWSDEIFHMFEIDARYFGASYEAFLNAIHPEDRDAVNKAYQDSLENKRSYEITHRLLLKDGRVKYVHERCRTDYDEHGEPIRSLGTVQDVTERVRSLQALQDSERQLTKLNETLEERVQQRTRELQSAKDNAEKANRAKSDFLSRMSHELRTPLNAILGFTQLLEMQRLTDKQRDFNGEVNRAGTHLLKLINDLLDLSRIESGRLSVLIGRVDMAKVVREATTLLETQANEKDIQICNNIEPSDNLSVYADETRVKQIVTNFLSNAVKFSSRGRRIDIRCQSTNTNMLRLCIVDNGPGISSDQQARLFTPFERLGAASRNVDGVGIGLALCKSLAQLMGGNIGVISQTGEGSTFWVEFPTIDAPNLLSGKEHKQPTPKSIKPNENEVLCVLYVEDNASNLRLVEAIFEYQQDVRFISATTGGYGLSVAKQYLPDLILLDIHLPDLSGYDVLSQLRRHPTTRQIPVIALSADAMPFDIERGLKAGFNAYLTKPIDVRALLQAIEETLGDEVKDIPVTSEI